MSDYARYVREGSAVVWEKADSTGHEKRYVYAGGRMAYTKEAWVTCTLPKTLSTQTTQLATTSVTADANGDTSTATISLPGLPPEANAVEVRLVKGNALVATQHMDRPDGGQWCGYEQAVFAGLPEGNDYQAGITLFFREGRAKIMPLKAYLVERMKLGIVKGKLAAWTIKQLKADNDSVSEETTTGFAGLAPDGAEDYTASAREGSEMTAVAQGKNADDAPVPNGSTSVSVQGSAGTSVSLAAPSLGAASAASGATLNGGIVPQCTKHGLDTYYATDHLGTVRFVKTVDDNTGGEVASSTHDYEPFGVEITPADSCDNTHKFTGHERDVETGNDYMHFRFYGASIGRFQKPDSNFDSPIANPQGWNLYSYVKGNPVNFNDPTGHMARGDGGHHRGTPYPSWLGYDDMPDLDDYLWGGAEFNPENTMRDWINEWGRNLNQAIIALQGVLAEPPTVPLFTGVGTGSGAYLMKGPFLELVKTVLTFAHILPEMPAPYEAAETVAAGREILIKLLNFLVAEGMQAFCNSIISGAVPDRARASIRASDLDAANGGFEAWQWVMENATKDDMRMPSSIWQMINESTASFVAIRNATGYANTMQMLEDWAILPNTGAIEQWVTSWEKNH